MTKTKVDTVFFFRYVLMDHLLWLEPTKVMYAQRLDLHHGAISKSVTIVSRSGQMYGAKCIMNI